VETRLPTAVLLSPWHESLIAHCRREWEPGTRHRYGVAGNILPVQTLELLHGRHYWDVMVGNDHGPDYNKHAAKVMSLVKDATGN
tara:strand:+ start:16257 stop:16511 length:255 start_codon:yes stop_codon:yes gene_type:complete